MGEVRVAEVAAFGELDRRVVEVAGKEVGIFRLGSEFFAYENKCPHLEGPVCQGKILPCAQEDIQPDGSSNGRVFSQTKMNAKVRLRKVPLKIVDGSIYLSVATD
jgi:nitrite reductase/ring-hydroxylating ferredoxin subunit